MMVAKYIGDGGSLAKSHSFSGRPAFGTTTLRDDSILHYELSDADPRAPIISDPPPAAEHIRGLNYDVEVVDVWLDKCVSVRAEKYLSKEIAAALRSRAEWHRQEGRDAVAVVLQDLAREVEEAL